MKRLLWVTLAALLLLASCSAGRTAYKCNGRKGQRVPMGVL
ncbi:MAG TPA: hypothetical protein PK499_11140 [Flavobacteriales bacterium]|nr:hypothetical protein [Flavobacteriales bacterium]HPJ52933.1 hypothetical protein [Flavobacteriales bacterium]HPQ59226.1 hypothetical protein [Flavobacteriales bacterium]HRW89705.1 hypothetical protein [Flavobacteriales bacterium]